MKKKPVGRPAKKKLLGVWLTNPEIKEYRAQCKALKLKPADKLRDMVNTFSGIKGKK